MLKKLDAYFIDLIKGKRKGPLAIMVKILLRLLSLFYQLIISCRNWAFDHGCFKQYYAPVPLVISIGNIVAGGTGKTPVTLMIAQEFYKDWTIAILSRGYRSYAEYLGTPVVLSSGDGPTYPASYCGDEPYLLSQNLPKALVFVGKDRHQSSNLAAKAGAQLILLDDGMQHRHLARDLEVVVMNAQDPFGQGYFLPRGFLRESISSLSRAHLIIVNHVNEKEEFNSIKKEISKYSSAPMIGTKMEVMEIVDLEGQSLPDLQNKKVSIFCAIAHPDSFLKTVRNLGAEPVEQKFLSDHLTLTNDELTEFCQCSMAKGAEWVLCTEKDFVKLDKASLNSLPIACVKMRLAIIEGELHWKSFTEKAKRDLRRRI